MNFLGLPDPIQDQIVEHLFDGPEPTYNQEGKIISPFVKCSSQTRRIFSRNHIRWCRTIVSSRRLEQSLCAVPNSPSPLFSSNATTWTHSRRVTPRQEDMSNPKIAHYGMIYAPMSLVLETSIMSTSSSSFPVVHLCPNIPFYNGNNSYQPERADIKRKFTVAATCNIKNLLCIKVDLQNDTVTNCRDSDCPNVSKHVEPMPQCPVLACIHRHIGPLSVENGHGLHTKCITVIIAWKIGTPDLSLTK